MWLVQHFMYGMNYELKIIFNVLMAMDIRPDSRNHNVHVCVSINIINWSRRIRIKYVGACYMYVITARGLLEKVHREMRAWFRAVGVHSLSYVASALNSADIPDSSCDDIRELWC